MKEAVAILSIAAIAIAVSSQIWLIFLIMRGSPALAIVALIVPFFTWYFAIHNWDIAKRPVFCQLLGCLLFFVSACVLPDYFESTQSATHP